MGFIEGVIQYKWVIAFYLAIILLVILNRKKFQFQAKIIAMYRTTFGIKVIDRIGTKYAEVVKLLGYISIGIAFVGMAVIMILLAKGFFDMFSQPDAPPVISPVLPGVPIPGLDITVPLIIGWLVLFITILVHEFSHGIVSKAHGVPVRSTGVFFLGPLMGAFVEPDEKKLAKSSDVVKYSIIAAGPVSNFILAILALLIAALIISPVTDHFTPPVGVEFTAINESLPAAASGMQLGEVYTFVNNQTVVSLSQFETALGKVNPGEAIVIGNSEKKYTVITTSRPENPERAIIGVNVKTTYLNEGTPVHKILKWITEFFSWLFILSVGIGFANLLPLGPVDGGQMIKEALERIRGKNKGAQTWVKITILVLILILILLILPHII
jgi:membrane-associated protease RseP (regulator of RpoE activity)